MSIRLLEELLLQLDEEGKSRMIVQLPMDVFYIIRTTLEV